MNPEPIDALSFRTLARRLLLLFHRGFVRRARAEQRAILARLDTSCACTERSECVSAGEEDFPPSAILFGDENGQAELTTDIGYWAMEDTSDVSAWEEDDDDTFA